MCLFVCNKISTVENSDYFFKIKWFWNVHARSKTNFSFKPSRSTNILSKLFTCFCNDTWALALPSREEYCLTGRTGKRLNVSLTVHHELIIQNTNVMHLLSASRWYFGKRRLFFSFSSDWSEENNVVFSEIYKAAILSFLTKQYKNSIWVL